MIITADVKMNEPCGNQRVLTQYSISYEVDSLLGLHRLEWVQTNRRFLLYAGALTSLAGLSVSPR